MGHVCDADVMEIEVVIDGRSLTMRHCLECGARSWQRNQTDVSFVRLRDALTESDFALK